MCNVFSLTKLTGRYELEYKGLYVNGFLYWLTSTISSRVILALDIKHIVFSEIQCPCPPPWTWFLLGTLKGCLCVICHSPHDELWVMNEHNVCKSWSKANISFHRQLSQVVVLVYLGWGKTSFVEEHKWIHNLRHVDRFVYESEQDLDDMSCVRRLWSQGICGESRLIITLSFQNLDFGKHKFLLFLLLLIIVLVWLFE